MCNNIDGYSNSYNDRLNFRKDLNNHSNIINHGIPDKNFAKNDSNYLYNGMINYNTTLVSSNDQNLSIFNQGDSIQCHRSNDLIQGHQIDRKFDNSNKSQEISYQKDPLELTPEEFSSWKALLWNLPTIGDIDIDLLGYTVRTTATTTPATTTATTTTAGKPDELSTPAETLSRTAGCCAMSDTVDDNDSDSLSERLSKQKIISPDCESSVKDNDKGFDSSSEVDKSHSSRAIASSEVFSSVKRSRFGRTVRMRYEFSEIERKDSIENPKTEDDDDSSLASSSVKAEAPEDTGITVRRKRGRPRLNRVGYHCSQCALSTTPQWRYLTRYEAALAKSSKFNFPYIDPKIYTLTDEADMQWVTDANPDISPEIAEKLKRIGPRGKILVCNGCWLVARKHMKRRIF